MKSKKKLIIILSIIIILTSVSGVISYLLKTSNKNNTFEIGQVKNNISEEFDNNIKSNVSISNDGNVKEYIRVFINIYYKDKDGVILNDKPIKDTDYSINISSSSNWLYNNTDNFYYYKLPVAPNQETDILIDECKELIKHDDKILNVDILSQSIQAEPISAITSSWNVNIINGNISLGN